MKLIPLRASSVSIIRLANAKPKMRLKFFMLSSLKYVGCSMLKSEMPLIITDDLLHQCRMELKLLSEVLEPSSNVVEKSYIDKHTLISLNVLLAKTRRALLSGFVHEVNGFKSL